jgi:hypothetical protein
MAMPSFLYPDLDGQGNKSPVKRQALSEVKAYRTYPQIGEGREHEQVCSIFRREG